MADRHARPVPPWLLIAVPSLVTVEMFVLVTWSPDAMPWSVRLVLCVVGAFGAFTVGALTHARTEGGSRG